MKFIVSLLLFGFHLNLLAQVQEKNIVKNTGGLYHLSDPIYPQRYYVPQHELLFSEKPYSNFETAHLADVNTALLSYFSCNSIEWLKKISVKKDFPANYEQTTFNYRKEKSFIEPFKLYIISQFYFTYQKELYCIAMTHVIYAYKSMRLFPVILIKRNNTWFISDNADILLFSAYFRIKPEYWSDFFNKEVTLPVPILKNIDYFGSRFLASYDYYYSNIVFDNDSLNINTKIPLDKLNVSQPNIDIKQFKQGYFQLIKKVGNTIDLNSYEKGTNEITQFFSNLTKAHSDTTAEQAMAYWLFSKDTLYQRKNSIGYSYLKKDFVNYYECKWACK